MKTAMKLTTTILAVAVLAAAAWAQNTDAIDQARSVAKSLQQKDANDSNAALDAAGTPANTPAAPASAPAGNKPAPGAPAPAVKPAVIPGSQNNGAQNSGSPSAPAPVKAAAPAPAKPAPAPAPKATASAHNQLQKVNVAASADSIQIELNSKQDVTPKVSKLASPARILIELPETAVATASNKIPVNNGGVKGVRIGMDGKTPPTTSVVIDLDKAMNFEVTPSAGGKLVLTLQGDGGAHTAAPVVAKAVAPPAKPAAEPKVAAAKPASTPKAPEAKAVVAKVETKLAAPAAGPFTPKPQTKVESKPAAKDVKVEVAKADANKSEMNKADANKAETAKDAVKAESAAQPAATAADAAKTKPEEKKEDKKWAMNGKRDPFFSPVVQQSGSGCSTGKKCLEIGNINLRGVVKSDTGFIAVVTNSLNKAYFLRENDPVFNGYVVKITGDSVVFSETVQDKLGKPFTREVVKRIFTPAV